MATFPLDADIFRGGGCMYIYMKVHVDNRAAGLEAGTWALVMWTVHYFGPECKEHH